MNGMKLFNAMANVEECLIDRACSSAPAAAEKKEKNPRFRRLIAAACIGLIAVGGLVFYLASRVPTYRYAHFSAAEIAEMSGINREFLGDGTRAYLKTYVPDEQYLNLKPIPTDEYLPIYNTVRTPKALSKEELYAFAEPLYNDLCAAFGMEKQELKYEDHRDHALLGSPDPYLELTTRAANGPHCTFWQREFLMFVSLYPHSELSIDGNPIAVDQRMSDAEMAASLQGLRQQLCDLFHADLPDIKIDRAFNAYFEHGAVGIHVYFYKKTEDPDMEKYADDYLPYDSDIIEIDFTNHTPYTTESDSILSCVYSIRYTKRFSGWLRLQTIANVRRLPLEEAEQMLFAGYTFGLHSCPLCMAAQPEVDFHGYDFVDLAYYRGVPFYVFYKRLDDARNGLQTYAYTYVPAFEVTNLEEFFESQKIRHWYQDPKEEGEAEKAREERAFFESVTGAGDYRAAFSA